MAAITRGFAIRPVWGLIALRAFFPLHLFLLILPATVRTVEVTVSLPVCCRRQQLSQPALSPRLATGRLTP